MSICMYYNTYILYTTIYQYYNRYSRIDTYIPMLLSLCRILYYSFFYFFILSLFSTSLFIRMKVIYRLLFCKGSAARKYGKHQSLIDRKLCMTLRNRRLRFPENFSDQLFALLSLCGGSYTLHIKGSR